MKMNAPIVFIIFVCTLISCSVYTVTGQSCTPGNSACINSTQCCSGDCITSICRDGCTIGGFICDIPSDCCSRNCYGYDPDSSQTGVCQQGTDCTDGGGLCTQRADCCSYNCYNGECQVAGGDRCTGETGKCDDGAVCCSFSCINGQCSHAVTLKASPMLWIVTAVVFYKGLA